MTCDNGTSDYLCEGWRTRAAAIRGRDGGRCRACNRQEEAVRLEVHHRTYGMPGLCGRCVLTGVEDDDLVTLCIDCHDAITSIRRRLRYAAREIEAASLDAPQVHPSTASVRHPVDADDIATVIARAGYAPPRAALW
jgi:hypothetical protein